MRNLETERLILRPFQSSDLDRFAELAADSDFMRFSLKGALTREEAIQLFKRITAARRVGKPSQFAVIVRSTGALIGFCGFFLQIVDETEELEIAYRLHPDFWSRGIATEAARAIRDHAFEGLGRGARNLNYSSGQHRVAPRGGEEWTDGRKADQVPRLFGSDLLA